MTRPLDHTLISLRTAEGGEMLFRMIEVQVDLNADGEVVLIRPLGEDGQPIAIDPFGTLGKTIFVKSTAYLPTLVWRDTI